MPDALMKYPLDAEHSMAQIRFKERGFVDWKKIPPPSPEDLQPQNMHPKIYRPESRAMEITPPFDGLLKL